ncbi:MAG: hypothetical protein HPY83_16725 [Anaerolineae bacterium]|nr:hypothetical protein [Anaerolineae bacterium]
MVHYLRIYGLLIIAFHLASPWLDVEHAWGAGGFAFLPGPVRIGVAAVAVLSLSPLAGAAWRQVEGLGRRLLRIQDRLAGSPGSRLRLRVCAAVMFFPLFWVARLQHLRWGDAYIFAHAISHPEVRLTYNWQSPLDLFLHAKLWSLLNAAWGWDVEHTYALISCLAGVAYVYLLLESLPYWGETSSEKATALTFFLTLGSLQLFFGYVESYTILPVGILGFLVLGLRFLSGNGALWPAAAVLAFTHSLSLSTLPLLLALAYLVWHGYRARGLSPERLALEAGGPMLVMALLVLSIMTAGGHGIQALLTHDFPGGGDASWFVPLFRTETRWQHYTMFSWAHLRDILNQQILVAPFGLATVTGVLVLRRRSVRWKEPWFRFLILAAGAYLLLTFVWNPDYGGRRDWDLFAPASFPLTALAVYLVNRYLEPREREQATVLIAAVSLMHLGPWIHFNAQPWPWD